MRKGAVVLLSGGQDSATCLAWAISEGFDPIHTVSFDYGQRHIVELFAAKRLSQLAGAKSHVVIPVTSFAAIGNSALLSEGEDISSKHNIAEDLPASFVPGRNLIFVTLGASWAFGLGIRTIITGVCQTDYSGYPDCRDETMRALELAINLGFGLNVTDQMKIETPLMYLTKAQTIEVMKKTGKLDWYKWTHTCYEGSRPPCGKCPACLLRAKGFEEAGIKDPLFWD